MKIKVMVQFGNEVESFLCSSYANASEVAEYWTSIGFPVSILVMREVE